MESVVKVGVLSDIHGNFPALQAVLMALNDCDRIFCLGDLTGYGPFPSEVVDLILTRCDIVTLAGNHDRFLFGEGIKKQNQIVKQSVQNTKLLLSPTQIAVLQSLPLQRREKIDGKLVLMVHGSPWCPLNEYIYPDYPDFERFGDLLEDVILIGHTHYAFVRKVGEKLLLNPGSCGQARDVRGQASYAIWDTQSHEVKLCRVKYPIQETIERFRALNWPEELVTFLQPRT